MAKYHYLTGKVHWAKVLGDPVDNYNRDGKEWTFDFTPEKADLKLFKELGIEKKLKEKGDNRGTFIQFKQKATRADGTPNRPITVVDARNRPWDKSIKIGNESLAEVKFEVVPYSSTIGVYPQGLRILDLVPYVRQEFDELPEDNEYVRKADEFNPVSEEEMNVSEEALETNPLNIDE